MAIVVKSMATSGVDGFMVEIGGAENIRREDITRVLGCRDLDVSSSQMYAIA